VLVLVLSASGGSVGTAEAYHSDTERQSTGAEPARRRQQQARSCSETTRRGNSHALRCVQDRNKKFILGVFLTSLPSLAFLPIFSVFPLLLRVDSQAQIQVKKIPRDAVNSPSGRRENDICSHQTRSLSCKYNKYVFAAEIRQQTHFWCIKPRGRVYGGCKISSYFSQMKI